LKHNVTSATAYTKGGVSGAALHEQFSGTAKLRAMDVPVRTLMAFEGH